MLPDRLAEIRARCDQFERIGTSARMVLDARDYAHWSDVRFLLVDRDRLATDVAQARTQSRLPVIPRTHVETSDDTIAMTPPTAYSAVPSITIRLPPPPAPELDFDRPFADTLSDTAVHNAAVARCATAVERAMGDAARRRLDVHAMRALIDRAIADCRRMT